ncbi:hypothetical protein APHAL10511_000082 [Amanita phalloides]|nr:hypothetical protein APHAL10511_000082 [Amanita phalloides]
MSSNKSKLRQARDALDKKDHAKAKELASEVLDYEPSNYNAHVFLGLASLGLGEHDESEQAYRKAIEIHPDQQLAWQGLSKLQERTERWLECVESLYQIMDIQCHQNDGVKCAETLQRIIDICRQHCDRLKLIDALCYLLPNSRFYMLLSTLPEPDNSSPLDTTTMSVQRSIYTSLPLFEEIASLIESYEEDMMSKEIQKRRTRLNAPDLKQLQKLVGQEVWSSSRLPEIYTEILNHPDAADDQRREAESKLLRYKYRYLCSLPNDDTSIEMKKRILCDVDELIRSAVVLQIPDEFIWNLSLEHQDSEMVGTYDRQLLQDFLKLFPNALITKLLNGFFTYMGLTPLGDDKDNDFASLGAEECYNVILDTFAGISGNLFANRVLAEVYLKEEEYENAIRTADRALGLLEGRERDIGINLNRAKMGMKTIKATSLVHLYPPKHHARALVIIDDVLSHNADNTTCLLGKAFILQASQKWEEARSHFLRVANLLPEDEPDRLRSIEEAAWCQIHFGQQEEGLTSLQHVLASLNALHGRGVDRARCLWRIGQCQWKMDSGTREECYRCLIESLKQDPSYAPAFTSLGVYYLENVPPDPIRASKCFQRAFELDSREGEAARRLAESFAEDQEWDLVEVVARRTIEGEGDLEGGLQSGSPVHGALRPTNSWAWKAIGIVELNRENYADAIKVLQTSLTTNINDGSLWLRLGEAYSKAGRYVAALKAFGKAKDLEPDDWLCSYFIAEVYRHTGEFQEAIMIYTNILSKRPNEPVIRVSLTRTYLDLGRSEHSEGFQERAENSFLMAIWQALRTVQGDPVTIAWKLLGDALFYLSNQQKYNNDMAIRNILKQVTQEFRLDVEDEDLPVFIPWSGVVDEAPMDRKQVLAAALMVYRYRLSVKSPGTVSSSQWYDLGVGLQVWTSKTRNTSEDITTKVKSCLTQALQENPHDASYWAALGTFHFLNKVKIAEYAYSRALEIDPKDTVHWNNLGFLYLHHNDFELANESFVRAQTLDPDNATSWVGQALLRSLTGHQSEAHDLLAYAVTLNPTKPEADLQFGHSTFQKYLNSPDAPAMSHQLILAFFALRRYCSCRDDAFAYHLFGLVSECLEKLELAEELLGKSTSLLEAEYEDSEDPTIERQFTMANSNSARLQLSKGDFTNASDSFQNVLGLLTEGDDVTTIKLRVHGHLGYGLAKFMNSELDSAIDSFQTALDYAQGDPLLRGHATILLSQAMWTIGTEDSREMAQSQLLQCIAADPMNLTAIKILAGMGILSNDETLVDAALSELLGMPAEQRQALDPFDDVDHMLIQYSLAKGDSKSAFTFAQRALHGAPSNMNYRTRLATMLLQQKSPQSAIALLSGHSEGIPQDPQLLSQQLCLLATAYALVDSRNEIILGLRSAQKAIMMLPSNVRSWQTLAFVKSRAALCQ